MKNKDYTLRSGKENVIANNRSKMAEQQHSNANEFVRQEQAAVKGMAGRPPKMEDRYYNFDACMTSNGYHAQEFAKALTKNIDHVAYPVRQTPDKSQD